MKATAELIKEHEGITLMLSIMQKVVEKIRKSQVPEAADIDRVIEFLSVFADKCHHGKEEGILFPELVRKGFPQESGPIAVMLYEHRIGRGYIKEMSEHFHEYKSGNRDSLRAVAEDMQKYITLLTAHIRKENQILFPMADNALAEDVQNQLYERYEKLEEEIIGRGKHEEFHRLLHELKTLYNV